MGLISIQIKNYETCPKPVLFCCFFRLNLQPRRAIGERNEKSSSRSSVQQKKLNVTLPTEENCRIFLRLLRWTHPTTSGALTAEESSANPPRIVIFRNARTSRATNAKQLKWSFNNDVTKYILTPSTVTPKCPF